jgi:glyoxylase-like metal-dependent hydrolase (beta-lactamase superfamily II)
MEIVPGLHCIAGVGLGVNAYVWHPAPTERTDGEPIVFDCGYPWHAGALFDSLRALGCPVEQVRTIAVTHDDYDHTGALAELAEASGALVVAHESEVDSLSGTVWRPMPIYRSPFSLFLRGVTGLAYAARPKRAVTVTRPVQDGALLPGGWVAVHTPGHTPGHLAYWHPAARALIAGDALGSRLRGHILAPVGAYSVDNREVIPSVRKLAALEPDVICFGHGPEIIGGAAGALHSLARSLK